MTDNLRESLSALIDNEASEIEVHRLLRQLESDDGLRPSWINFQQVRAIVRGEKVISSSLHFALNARIREAIDSEESHGGSQSLTSSSPRKYYAPVAGLAVAASLVVAVLVGFNVGQENTAVTGKGQNLVDSGRARVIDTEPVVAGPDQQEFMSATFDSGELRELDDERQRQLRAYLNEHDRMARMNPNVRTVLFNQSEGK